MSFGQCHNRRHLLSRYKPAGYRSDRCNDGWQTRTRLQSCCHRPWASDMNCCCWCRSHSTLARTHLRAAKPMRSVSNEREEFHSSPQRSIGSEMSSRAMERPKSPGPQLALLLSPIRWRKTHNCKRESWSSKQPREC